MPVGNINIKIIKTNPSKNCRQESSGRHAIGVVVAENRYSLIILDGRENSLHRLSHIAKLEWVMDVPLIVRYFRRHCQPLFPRLNLPFHKCYAL